MVGSFVIPSSFARRVAKLYAVIRASSFFPHPRYQRNPRSKLSVGAEPRSVIRGSEKVRHSRELPAAIQRRANSRACGISPVLKGRI
jgi:hypothetical protein